MKTILLVGCLLAFAQMGLTYSVQDMIQVMTPTGTSPGCVSFSPFVNNMDPNKGSIPKMDLITQLLTNLITQTNYRCIMIYNMGKSYNINTIAAAQKLGIKVLTHVYLVTNDTKGSNQDSISAAIPVAKAYDNIIGISCGSEVAYNTNDMDSTYNVVSDCITQLRAANVTQPLGYIDVATVWCGQSYPCTNRWTKMAKVVDFIGLDEFPWWENTYSNYYTCEKAENAAGQTFFRYNLVKQLYSDVPVLLTEFGWPSSAGPDLPSQPNAYTGQTCGIGNPVNYRKVNQQTINLCAKYKVGCNIFTSFNEQWKVSGGAANNPYDVQNFRGFCSGSPPYNCTNLFSGTDSDYARSVGYPSVPTSGGVALIISGAALIIALVSFLVM
jgi:exo-beta-1,3-glucanase (GH17 family)